MKLIPQLQGITDPMAKGSVIGASQHSVNRQPIRWLSHLFGPCRSGVFFKSTANCQATATRQFTSNLSRPSQARTRLKMQTIKLTYALTLRRPR